VGRFLTFLGLSLGQDSLFDTELKYCGRLAVIINAQQYLPPPRKTPEGNGEKKELTEDMECI
jgi:hypothetical protein